MEFPSLGNTLSWSGRRAGHDVKCRLDRALANNEWHNLSPCSFVEYLGMIASVHMLIVASIEDKVLKFRQQFRFDKRWICEDGLMESIERGWSTQRRGRNMGIVDKIHNCRHEISVWRKENPSHGKEKNKYSTESSGGSSKRYDKI